MTKNTPLYIIDAYALIYRSYFAFMSRPLRTKDGVNVSALYGFAQAVTSIVKNNKDIALVAAYDSPTCTFRHKMYPQYKATRQKAPQDLHDQVPLTENFLSALGVSQLKMDGYEADDIIATLAALCKKDKRTCYILSGDKDLLQLVDENTFELRPAKKQTGNFGAWDKLSPIEVRQEWGVKTTQILDLLSLTGDKSDNVPGVPGIGEKGATTLLTRFGSLDAIYENISAVAGGIAGKLVAGKESAYLSKKLITLDSNVPLKADLSTFEIANINTNAAAEFLLLHGIPSVAKELGKCEEVMADNVQLKAPEGKYTSITTLEEAKSFFKKIKDAKCAAFDFETDSINALNANPLGISLCITEGEAVYIPMVSHGKEKNSPFVEGEEIKKLLCDLFSDSEITLAAHNAKFDLEVAITFGCISGEAELKCKLWDTMIAAWLCDPSRAAYSLESMASYYLSLKGLSYKDVVSAGGIFSDAELQIATQYSCEDSDFCLRLKNILDTELKKINAEKLFYEIEMPLLPILSGAERVGIKIDPSYLRTYGEELRLKLESIQEETWKTVGHEFNLSSPKQLQQILFVERGLKPGKKTKTGYSTDVEVLEELSLLDIVPRLILKHRSLSKLKGTYVDTLADLADSNGRIHTSFVQSGTATGRLSSRDPNLQNIPIRDEEGRKIRQAFIAEEGKILVSADYAQIELVVLAHLSGDAALIDAFKNGKDVHAKTAALIFDVDESSVDATQRRIAKTINFGVIYGMSAFRLSNELGIPRTQAADFIDAYFNTYSGVREFMDGVIRETEKTGYAVTLAGRRRLIQTINSPNKTEKSAAERVAINTPIQGSAADIVKQAMLNLDKELAAHSSLNAKLLLQVHDELILECPQNSADETSLLVKNVMENAVKLNVPLRVSVEKAKRWGDLH
ncbi:MAG: DNA polymerase I [Termitinemataceae bacterium]|nr:MAG: DNA polymerase I [Termitinemataceae bacterium]